MIDTKYFYNYLLRMEAIAKIGLKYSTDPYAIDNYNEINILTTEMIKKFCEVNFDRPNYFEKDIYPTPNISVRTIIKNSENKFLFVREAKDNTYSLPGGWCDFFETPSESASKEVSQEAGLEVEITRLVGILDHTPFKRDASIPEYVLVFEGKPKSDFHEHCYETNDVGFYGIDEIPVLSRKNPKDELMRILNASINGETIFD